MPELNEGKRPRFRDVVVRVLTPITGPWNRRNLLGWIWLIALVFFIKGCVIDQYTIPSGSMEPTLHGEGRFFHDDRVVVNKWAYGPRIPFTTIRLWKWGGPKRWDIVVFRSVSETSQHKALIKRVVGLPGEHIRIRNGKLEVNGAVEAFPAGMPEKMYYVSDEDIILKMRLARTDEERESWRLLRQKYPLRYGGLDDDTYCVVPEDQYLFLGDNSLYSVDGRVWGWVPQKNLRGRAFAIWWPWSRRRDFSGSSSTWWGMLLLYGIPASLVTYEMWHAIAERRRREKQE